MVCLRAGAIAAWSALVATIPGCDEGVALKDFPKRMAQAVCSNVERCCSPADLAEVGYEEVRTKADCLSSVHEFYEPAPEFIGPAQQEGELRYHPDRAHRCLDAIERAGCADAFPAICERIVTPRAEFGQACQTPWSCRDGYCAADQRGDGSGVCVAYLQRGAPCHDRTACGSGLYCRCPDEDPNCLDAESSSGTCAPYAVLYADCRDHRDCDAELDHYCSPEGVCRLASAEGQPCGQGQTCRNDLFCFSASEPPVCKQPCTPMVYELGCQTTGRAARAGSVLLLLLIWGLLRRSR